ncbi:hypothetical protein BaRGS_00002834 [Batillaria attramentaria]|uniref:Uncharacterized protein n=1 Tax=Batillaria attramentaria TaxID=370345 RepID=A0ABD0M4E8_9CAEN
MLVVVVVTELFSRDADTLMPSYARSQTRLPKGYTCMANLVMADYARLLRYLFLQRYIQISLVRGLAHIVTAASI